MAISKLSPRIEDSGDARFRSLLTPHPAWTIVRAASLWADLGASR